MVILTLAFECKAILDISKRFQKKKKKKEKGASENTALDYWTFVVKAYLK